MPGAAPCPMGGGQAAAWLAGGSLMRNRNTLKEQATLTPAQLVLLEYCFYPLFTVPSSTLLLVSLSLDHSPPSPLCSLLSQRAGPPLCCTTPPPPPTQLLALLSTQPPSSLTPRLCPCEGKALWGLTRNCIEHIYIYCITCIIEAHS